MQPDVRIRITVRDGEGDGSVESGAFDLGNVPPAIGSIVLPTDIVTGTATVKYAIFDTKSDPAQIATLDVQTAQLHLAFGLLLILSTLIGGLQ